MQHFYAEEIRDSFCLLSPEDARHALRVLRMKAGDPVAVCVRGEHYRGVLAEAPDGAPGVRLLEPLPSTEAALRITLFQGLPKADKMEWIVQKAVELGVHRIVPVKMSRCVVKLEDRDVPKKLERWQRIAREAGIQSGRCLIPEIARPVTWKELSGELSLPEACVVPWESASGIGPKAFAAAHGALSSLGILIGPEGGISPEEIAQLPPSVLPITLGKRILRTETAGLAAAAAFLALYGDMDT